jgi:hypothetical protein
MKTSIKSFKETAVKILLLCALTTFVYNAEAQKRPSPGKTVGGGGVKKPATTPSRPSTNNQGNRKPDIGNSGGSKAGGNKVNVGSNNRGDVNINVDNSKDIRINNSHNTTVRRNSYHSYNRPPHRYGHHRYYCHHSYWYHPYRPFYWGPHWHPWGFFITAMATTAIIVSVNNQPYYYDQGVYYLAGNGGYTVVQAPVGASVSTLPQGYQTVTINETTNNYYYGGAYYEKSGSGYKVVAPMAGTVIENLPEGGEEVTMGDVTYVKIGETYYQPIQQDGKSMYEVVQVEEDN